MEHPENSGEYKGLVVNAGIEQPSSVNPYLKRKPKKRQLSVAEYVEGIVKGDVTILSRAVTLVESVKPEHQAIAQEVIEKCLPYSGNSVRVGISGVPGAGKSTSIDVFGLHVLEKYGGKLAVLAIDPSSERSKGSILGDKTRMEKLSVHPKSFIRPSPSARKKSSLVNLFLIAALSMPCVLGYNVWSWDGFAVFGGAVLDFEDFLVSNLFLPLGSLVYLLFCVSRCGWGWKNYKQEVNTGEGPKMQDWMRGYLTYGLPLIVLFIFAFGLYDKFFA